MKCPNCAKPYYFALGNNDSNCSCRACKYRGIIYEIKYENYHQNKYSKSKLRTIGNDPLIYDIHLQLDIKSNDCILDFGCGRGDIVASISSITNNILGLDRDIRLAKDFFPDLKFKELKNLDLPFANNTFDKIVCVNVIEHIHNFDYLLKEFRRVLNNEGVLYITTYDTTFFLHDFLYDNTHYIEWNIKEFRELLSKNFQVIKSYKASSMFNLYPMNIVLKHILKPELVCICKKQNDTPRGIASKHIHNSPAYRRGKSSRDCRNIPCYDAGRRGIKTEISTNNPHQ